MKRLLLLFPLYLLFLSGVPCSPNDGCCEEEIHATAAAGQKSNDHDKTNSQKRDLPCSPFSPCGAYHGIAIPNNAIQVVQPPTPIAKLPFFYNEKPLLAYTPAIWQPPKQA